MQNTSRFAVREHDRSLDFEEFCLFSRNRGCRTRDFQYSPDSGPLKGVCLCGFASRKIGRKSSVPPGEASRTEEIER